MENKTYTEPKEMFKDLEEHIANETIWEKISDFFVYGVWHNMKEFRYNIKWYFHNLRLFRKQLWDWRPWDSETQMRLFAFGLEQVQYEMENGHEERTSANKKIAACKELIYQLRRDIEEETPWDKEKETIAEYSARLNAIRKKRYDEIHRLMIGQDPYDYKAISADDDGYEAYVEWFDGTGIEGWWD